CWKIWARRWAAKCARPRKPAPASRSLRRPARPRARPPARLAQPRTGSVYNRCVLTTQPPIFVSPRILLASHILAGLALIAILVWHLPAALFAGLLVYALVQSLAPLLQRQIPGTREHAHWLVVLLLVAAVVGAITALIIAAIAFVHSEHGNPA